MDRQELLKQYVARKRNFTWADLQGADLSDLELPEINLSRANLSDAIALGINLNSANLIKADLSGANLQGANLAGARCYKVNFSGANLDRANFLGADLTGANLEAALLQDTIMPDGTTYEEWLARQQEPEPETEALAGVEEPPLPPLLAAEEISTVQPKPLARLPKIPLCSLGLGYILWGALLAFGNGSAPLIFIAWAGSLIWTLDESLIWFVPITAALTVVASFNLSVLTLLIAGITLVIMFAGMIGSGFELKKTLIDSCFLSALSAIFTAMLQWCLFDSYFILTFILIFAIAAAGFGSLSALHLRAERFSPRQTWQIFAGITGLGLTSGWLIGKLF
ncbi:pentapeptide repeat-containing protein [Oscillatoria sp. FACHB-1406]|nr:pentapeptide repeat-containing protein [Oscillatoria sp. FACHB-1406]